MRVLARTSEETFALGRRLGGFCRGGEVFALTGELGSGKTVFAKGVAAGLGIDPDQVTSPTFLGLALHRSGRVPFAHADAYRVEDPAAFAREGWEDLTEGVRLVEWADRIMPILSAEAVWVRLMVLADGARQIEIENLPSEGKGG